MFKVLCSFLLIAISLSAQSIVITDYDKEINSFLFNGQWEKSDSLIGLKLENEPNSVRYNFMKAYNYFYARFIGNDNPFSREETMRQVKKYAWDAIKFGEESSESLENSFFTGVSYAYLARINAMERDFWLAYWNASKSENYLEDIIDLNPDFADAYLNLGIFEYFAARNITGLQNVLAWLGGMSGDSETGIEYVNKAAEEGHLFKDEANYVLGLIHNFGENDLPLAYEYWNALSEKFPSSNYFGLQVNRTYIGKLVEEKGVDFLNREFEDLDSLYGINNPVPLNLLGYSLMNQNRLDEALTVFKVNLKKYPDIANSYDSMAECYLNRGENENAIKYYKMAFEKLKTDTTVTDQFREFLEQNIRNQLEELSADLEV